MLVVLNRQGPHDGLQGQGQGQGQEGGGALCVKPRNQLNPKPTKPFLALPLGRNIVRVSARPMHVCMCARAFLCVGVCARARGCT